jgi:4-diphosphocytidyl-2-C-methyl-D-erythritol kinase
MVEFPNAKINLGLHVTEKRSDGFHNLETVFFPVKCFNDVLEVIVNEDEENDILTTSGLKTDARADDNLVIKALKLIRKEHTIPPLSIHLHKTIPSGAGLGGGSSDAAFMLKLLNEQFKVGISQNKLEEMAATPGADCAFFIKNTPAVATGIGNIFSPLKFTFKEYRLIVVIPPLHLSTPEAYRHIVPKQPALHLSEVLKKSPEEWQNYLINDFEAFAFTRYPELAKIKTRLYQSGAIYAAMSGSGSAIFGLFREVPAANWPDEYMIWEGNVKI